MSSISSVNYSSQITDLIEEYEKQEKALPPEEQRLFRQVIAPLLHQMRQEIAALTATGYSISVIQGHFLGFASRIQAAKNKFFAERKITLKAQNDVRAHLKAEAEDLDGCVLDFGGDSLPDLIAKAHAADGLVTRSFADSVMASVKEEEGLDAFDALSHAVGRAGLRAGMLTARVMAVPVHIAGGAVSFVAQTVTPTVVGDLCKAGFNKAVALAKEHAPDSVKDVYHGLRQRGDEIAERYELPADETAQFKKDATALVTVGVIGTAVKAAKAAKGLKKSDPRVIEGTCREVAEGAVAPTKKLLEETVTEVADDLAAFPPLAPKPKMRSMAERIYVPKIRAKAPLSRVAHPTSESCPEKLTALKPGRGEACVVESLERDPTTTYVNHEGFRKVGLTIGRAVSVVPNSSATIPAYKIHLDMGAALTREHTVINHGKPHYTSSAQLCSNHKEEDLMGSLLLTVINFPRKQIGKMMSDCLVTGVQKEGLYLDDKRATTVYMTTSPTVDLGARVSILAEKEILETNPRDIIWTDFLNLDLRIGTIEGCESCVETAKEINTVLLRLNMGAEKGPQLCVGLLNKAYDISSLVGRQVLVLTNLETTAKKELFGREEVGPVLLTVGGGTAVLEPAKPVENGYKLA